MLFACRRDAAAMVAAALLTSPPLRTPAWCGAPFPPYAFSLPWFEFPASGTAMRVVGDNRAEASKKLAPLLVLPSPGLTYEYLETLEALTISERRVAFAILTPSVNLDEVTAQASAAVAALECPKVHLLAHGTAAPAALALQAAQPEKIASLTLASPIANPADTSLLPVREVLTSGRAAAILAAKGSADSAAPRTCVDAELKSFLSRPAASTTDALLRDGAMPALSAHGDAASNTANLLRGVQSRRVPLLVTRGTDDVSSEAVAARILELVPSARLAVFEGSASLAHVDDRSRYNGVLLDFLDAVEGVQSRRSVMLPGSMRPGGTL